MLQTVAGTGIANNTIVIFTSDNGGERFSNIWPFTGKKTELLEGGLRIPAIVRWPGRRGGHGPNRRLSHGLAADAARGGRDSA